MNEVQESKLEVVAEALDTVARRLATVVLGFAALGAVAYFFLPKYVACIPKTTMCFFW